MDTRKMIIPLPVDESTRQVYHKVVAELTGDMDQSVEIYDAYCIVGPEEIMERLAHDLALALPLETRRTQ